MDEALAEAYIHGILVSSLDGNVITFNFKKEFNSIAVAAGASTLLFISTSALEILGEDRNLEFILSYGRDDLFAVIPGENVVVTTIIDRTIADLRGIDEIISNLKHITLKISGIVEAEEVEGGLLGILKEKIPESSLIMLLTKEGFPIMTSTFSVELTQTSAMLSAVYNTCYSMLSDDIKFLDFSVISGEKDYIIVHRIDDERVVGVVAPKDKKLTTLVAQIRESLLLTQTY